MRRGNDFAVGLAVIVAILGITGMALWLSRAELGPRPTHMVARIRDVGGAQVGAPVMIRGVEAGRITGISLDEKDIGWVDVRFSLSKGVIAPADPVLILAEASMFGQWSATLESRSVAPTNVEVQAQLEEPGARKGGAIPGATLPGLAQLAVVAGRIAGDVETVAKRFGVAFNDTAARELRATIRNVNSLSTVLRTTVGDQSQHLDEIAVKLKATIGTINSAAEALDRTAHRVDSSTSSGQIKELVTNARLASEDIREMAAQLKRSASSLSRTASSFESMVGHTDSVMVKLDRGQGTLGLLVNDPQLYRNVDSLMVALRTLAVDVKARPSRYVNVKIF